MSMAPACSRCNDARYLTRYASARQNDLVKCDKCGLLMDEEYEQFKREAWIKNQKPVGICELDLAPEEFAAYQSLRQQHPQASKATALSWMEGRRYDPAKDPEFLPEAREKFKEWRRKCVEESVGPIPEWIRRRLNGEPVEIHKWQENYYREYIAFHKLEEKPR